MLKANLCTILQLPPQCELVFRHFCSYLTTARKCIASWMPYMCCVKIFFHVTPTREVLSYYTLQITFRLSGRQDSMWRKLTAPIKITLSSKYRIPGLLTHLYSLYDIRLLQLLLIEVKLMKRANLLNSAMERKEFYIICI